MGARGKGTQLGRRECMHPGDSHRPREGGAGSREPGGGGDPERAGASGGPAGRGWGWLGGTRLRSPWASSPLAPLACTPLAPVIHGWRVVHQIDHRRQVRLMGPWSLWSQVARPPGKPQTGPRPPAHTHPPAPPMPLMNWDLVHKTAARRNRDCLAPAGPGSCAAEPPGRTAPPAGPRCHVLTAQCSITLLACGSSSHPVGGPLGEPPSRHPGSEQAVSCTETPAGG